MVRGTGMDAEFADQHRSDALRAPIRALGTVEDCSATWPVHGIGNAWSRLYFDGDFFLFAPPTDGPAISLVFVQTRDGNTAGQPDALGGGPTDKHLIYEGLSRVAADGVMAGASSVGSRVFFSVWHPELVSLRRELGLPRHPAQIVVSKEGRLTMTDFLFNQPEVPVFVVAGRECRARHTDEFLRRPWITVVPLEPGDLPGTIARLRTEHGLERISAVGGRTLASALIDAALVQDLYLTTSAIAGGEPNTPFYVGPAPPTLGAIVRKREAGTLQPIEFAHLGLS
jgi:riboflavin biosynthesis pyrimidine reductase